MGVMLADAQLTVHPPLSLFFQTLSCAVAEDRRATATPVTLYTPLRTRRRQSISYIAHSF